MASRPPAEICRGPRAGSRLADPRASARPHTSFAFSGMKKNGNQPSATSAVMATFRSPREATQMGIRGRTGWPMILRGRPRPVPSSGWQRYVVLRPVVDQGRLAGPDLAADLDDLAGAPERSVVGDAVPALDHLRPRGPQAQLEPAFRQGVDACRGHGQERRRPGVDRQNARADAHAFGQGGEVAHQAGAVESVGLGHPDEVQAGFLHFGDLASRLPEAAGVAERRGDLHARRVRRRFACCAGPPADRPARAGPPNSSAAQPSTAEPPDSSANSSGSAASPTTHRHGDGSGDPTSRPDGRGRPERD